jgi:hypothetical protein
MAQLLKSESWEAATRCVGMSTESYTQNVGFVMVTLLFDLHGRSSGLLRYVRKHRGNTSPALHQARSEMTTVPTLPKHFSIVDTDYYTQCASRDM